MVHTVGCFFVLFKKVISKFTLFLSYCFKEIDVNLHNAERKRSELIKEYDLTPSAFDKWGRQAKTTGSFKTVDDLTDEQRELIELRKRNKELEMQVDILKQAAVIMAKKGKESLQTKTAFQPCVVG